MSSSIFLISLIGFGLSAQAIPMPGGLLPYTAAIGAGLTTTQYHSQDELGQYSYGYAGGPSAKTETKTADGITRGSYSYVDAYGILQTANYISDPINGFQVARSDLPVGPLGTAAVALQPAIAAVGIPVNDGNFIGDTPEVIAAKAEHFRAHAEAAARAAL